ncbi:hypothetical protein [Streptomyces sp. NBC_01373]|uniref:hypothetical protein n=1 Tax=Streptomyces sp. NBC_01373 TaxID=2903843 RepID=UPI00224E3840|nr:hypothetical protein [Streptomyces sp. NBC_01373]MCX4699548.1 hypothetical protein [Streptomyces sp. NBC_01373]
MLNTTSNPFGLMATPAVTPAPTGHPSCLVDEACQHPDIDVPHERTDHDATALRIRTDWDEIEGAARARGVFTPAMERFHTEVGLLLAASPDPAATLDEVLNAISRDRTRNTAAEGCHVYPGLCERVDGEAGDKVDADGRHFDHGGRTYFVPGLDLPEDPEIWAEFRHLSGSTPIIGFMGWDLSPAEVRLKAQELRRMADEMDTLADQVDAAVAAAEARA